MSFLGPNLRDLGELWAGQDYVYDTRTNGAPMETRGNIEPAVIAQGWQCPLCQTVYAPHVDSCNCRKSERPFVINTSDGTVIQTFRPTHTSEMP